MELAANTQLLAGKPDVASVPFWAGTVGVSPKTIYREIERGNLRAAHVGARLVITKTAILEYLGEGANLNG